MPRTSDPKTAPSKARISGAAVKKSPARKAPTATAAAVQAVTPAKRREKPAEVVDTSPYLRFYPARNLHSRLIEILDQIEHSSDATLHRTRLSESVSELTAAGLDYYFTRTLKEAKVGFVTQQSANIGLIGVKQLMAPVIRNIVGRLEHAQLQAIAQSIREFMK